MAVQISGNDITVPRDGSFTRNVTIGGTLTYEDVTNIDSVGLVTARSGIEIGARPGVAASISVDGNMIVSGISTFGGDVQVSDKIIHTGDTNTAIRFPEADTITFETGGSERIRITGDGSHLLLGGTADVNEITETSSNTGMVIGSTSVGNGGLAIINSTSGTGRIYFGDATGSDGGRNRGQINYYHSSDYMMFATGASERLRIDSSGTIQVKGDGGNNVKIYGYDGSDLSWILGQNNSDDVELNNFRSGNLLLKTNGSERVRITSAGLFGIGTDAPDARLYVNGVSTANVITARTADSNGSAIINILSEGTTGNSRINFSDTAGTDGQISYSHNDRALIFATGGTTERLRITSGGSVNIGDNFGQTTYKTQIEATDQNVLRLVTDSDNADGVELVLRKDSASPADDDNIGNIYFQGNDSGGNATFYASMEAYSDDVTNGSENGYIRFRTRNDGTMAERVRIYSDGSLQLTEHLLLNDGKEIKLGNSSDMTIWHSGSDFTMYNSTGNLVISNASGTGAGEGAIVFKSGSNSTRWTITSGGDFVPASNNAFAIGSSSLRVSVIYSNGALNTSDRNEKNTIIESDLGLDFVNQLKPVSYKWNEDDGKTHYGLIAQDIEETVLTEGKEITDFGFIDKSEEGHMNLAYNELISPLIKAVQELSAEVAALKSQLNN